MEVDSNISLIDNSPLMSIESSPTLKIDEQLQQDYDDEESFNNRDRNDNTYLNVDENSIIESCNASTCADEYKEEEEEETIVEEEEIQSDDEISTRDNNYTNSGDILNQLLTAPVSNASFKHLRLNHQDLHFNSRLSPTTLNHLTPPTSSNTTPTNNNNTNNNNNKLIVLAPNKHSQVSTPMSYMKSNSGTTTTTTTANSQNSLRAKRSSSLSTPNTVSNQNQLHQQQQYDKHSPPPHHQSNPSPNLTSGTSTPTILISKSKKVNNTMTIMTENTIFSSRYFVRNWDTTPQHLTRMKQLSEFYDHFVNLPYKDLELKLKSDLLLIYNRIIGYFQLNYLHMKDLAIQIKCIGLFIQGYKPLLEFIEIGGTQILLEVLGFHYYKYENEDKKEALLLLTSIANNGRKYKEVICFDNGLDLLKQAVIYIPSIDINSIAKNFIVSIYQGNPKHSNEILDLLFEIFRNHSSPYNWKTISAHISSNNTPRSRRNSTINLLDDQNNANNNNQFASPRSIFNSPRNFTNFLMSPRTPATTNAFSNVNNNNGKNLSPTSSITFQANIPTPKNSDSTTPKLPFTKFTFLNVVESARNQLASAEEFRKSFDPNSLNNNNPNNANNANNNADPNNPNNTNNSIELSTQSILLIYSMVKEISKSYKIEQIRETKVLDIIFMNFSDEDVRVVRESVEMVKIAMQYPDENDIFSEMLIHRSLQGLSMISIVLGKRRFKSILKQFFKNSTMLNNSKEEINYAKNFLNLIFGVCSIINLILQNAIEHVNICKIVFESNIILTLLESILIIKEKYGDTNYSVDTAKEVTQLLRVCLILFNLNI